MDIGTFFVIGACLVTAAIVYFVLEYRMYGERESAQARVMRVQADAAALKKELAGYIAYADFLAAAKQKLAEKMKPAPVKVLREYVYIENIMQPPLKQLALGVVIVRYGIEFSFGFDLKLENFDIVKTTHGIEIQVAKPIFASPPNVKAQPPEIPVEGVITDEIGVVAEIKKKLQALSLQYGLFVASDEAVLALCSARLAEGLRSVLLTAPDVKQLPTIVVKYK